MRTSTKPGLVEGGSAVVEVERAGMLVGGIVSLGCTSGGKEVRRCLLVGAGLLSFVVPVEQLFPPPEKGEKVSNFSYEVSRPRSRV